MEGVGLRAPQSSVFQGDFGVGLRPLQERVGATNCIFWSLPGPPRRRPQHWRQLLPSRRKRGDLRELPLWSFGCIRSPLGDQRVGELKASSSGQSFEFGGLSCMYETL